MGALSKAASEINTRKGNYNQDDLEKTLALFYEPIGLAAMAMYRYPIAPVITDYCQTVAEAVEAHFLGLDHVAVGGLIPVIEGAGRELAAQRGLPSNGHTSDVLKALAEDCKQESKTKNMGAYDEVESMMDSFAFFMEQFMYVDHHGYTLADKTNRHGIAHGRYTDADYGRPLNFFKSIAAIDFLTFVSSFRANISWLAPTPTESSLELSRYYLALQKLGAKRPRRGCTGGQPKGFAP
jgi:hypothetical protein